jgi:hypothetical protein
MTTTAKVRREFHAPRLPDVVPVVVRIERKYLLRAGSGAGAGRAEKRAMEAGAQLPISQTGTPRL